MAQPWLPDACLTTRSAAQPMAAIVDAWTSEWFKRAPWQVLGNWDEASPQTANAYSILTRAKGFEITGKEGAEITLALAMLGAEGEDYSTSEDEDLLRKLGKRALQDLESRIADFLPKTDDAATDRFSTAFPRVFSLLIGPLGEAQIALECSMAQLVLMTRGTYRAIASDEGITNTDRVVEDLSVSVSARLGSASISLKDLAGLEKGDLLLLDSSPDDPADLMIEGQRSSLAFAISEAKNSFTLEFQERR